MSIQLDEYRDVAPKGTIDLLHRLGEMNKDKRFLHVTGTRYGGGAPEILRRLVPMMQGLGIESRWEVITGAQEFFAVAKSLYNAAQGYEQVIPDEMYQTYLEVNRRNAKTLNLDADLIMIHDLQPAGLVEHRQRGRWVWRCHLDISQPQRRVWSFLRQFVNRYDAAVFSLPAFTQRLNIPQYLIYPSIDPLSDKNRELGRSDVQRILDRLLIPRDKPIILQVSRFDRFSNLLGVVNAFRLARKHHECRLILAGGGVAHDPEGETVLAQVQESTKHDPDVHILQLPPEADMEINALQRAATIVLQQSLKEGFALAVAEAMWKGKPVIGGGASGIRFQILNEVTGFTVHSVEGAAFRLRYLLNNPELIGRMGAAAREHVRRNFLITRHLSDYLTLLCIFRDGATG
jgi:trehalose synthase